MNQTEIAESQAWMRNLFSGLVGLTPNQRAERIAAVRSIAVRALEDTTARSYVEWLIQQVEPDLPTEAQVFRAYYLDGQTARSIGRARYVDKRSIHRCNRRVLEAMLPIVFGLGGIYAEVEKQY